MHSPASLTSISTLPSASPALLDCNIETLHFGKFRAVRDTHVKIEPHTITAFIGPSGCGKSTVLRCLNRMNDMLRGFRFTGSVKYHGEDIYGRRIDPSAVRRYIGMVFQQPNPFAMSIYNNVAFGLRINQIDGPVSEHVEQALRRAALWEEVKNNLNSSALRLSGGQQQRLCIARALAIEPEVLLMDEPCASLDPVATHKIEQLMVTLKERYTLVIVTHNLQQASRVADSTGFMYVDTLALGGSGHLVEFGSTQDMFKRPREKETQQYLEGQFS